MNISESAKHLGPSTPLDRVTVVLILLLMICGIHFNCLVLYLFGKRKHYRLPSRLQLFSLAVDDMGTALLVEPLVITMFYRVDIFEGNDVLCRIFSNLLHIFPWGSIISLMILSFTRVVIVIYPLAFKIWVTRQRVMHFIFAKYAFITIFLVISNPLWTFIFIPSIQSCFVSYGARVAGDLVVPYINVIPYIVLMGSAIIVLLSAVVMGQICRQNFCGKRADGVTRNRAQMPSIARELLILVLIFILTNISIPILALKRYLDMNLSAEDEVVFAQVAKILFYVGPAANPVIYALRREDCRNNLHASFNRTIRTKKLARQTMIAEAGLQLVVCTKNQPTVNHISQGLGLVRRCATVASLGDRIKKSIKGQVSETKMSVYRTRSASASIDVSDRRIHHKENDGIIYKNTAALTM